MQIREVEMHTGLERANIRYYEKEGLLQPVRGENGYRAYSQADVDTLCRIKLLRQLDISVESIRRLQAEEITLGEVVTTRLGQIGEAVTALEDMRALCRTLLEDGASYGSLEAEHYLQLLALRGRQRDQWRQRDMEPKFHHPWRRLFARGTDQALATLVLCILWFGILGRRPPLHMSGWFLTWLISCAQWAVLIPLEALCLSKWGTTPGKWLLGLRLTNGEGGYLGFAEALERTWQVFCWGVGLELPIYGLVRLGICCHAEANEKPLRWEGDELYTYRAGKKLRDAGFIAVRAVAGFVSVWLVLNTLLPPNRGPLTAEMFTENFNSYYTYLTQDGGHYIDAQGRWQEAPADGALIIYSGDGRTTPPLNIQEENGRVVAVSYTDQGDGTEALVIGNVNQSLVAYRSLAGAQRGVSGMELLWEFQQMSQLQDPFANFSLDSMGLRVSNRAEWSGYSLAGNNMLFLTEGETGGSFSQTFAVELPK